MFAIIGIFTNTVLCITALAAGDPHIVTLDGLEYSFNGVGEYYLVYDEVSSLVVQVRAVQALDNEGKSLKGPYQLLWSHYSSIFSSVFILS